VSGCSCRLGKDDALEIVAAGSSVWSQSGSCRLVKEDALEVMAADIRLLGGDALDTAIVVPGPGWRLVKDDVSVGCYSPLPVLV
jgi:hypothetical protein